MPRARVAIVGIGCRFPGGADTPDRFWQLLCGGRDAITEIPRERFDVDAIFDHDPASAAAFYARWGGFIDGLDRFDAGFFGISPREARRIDPQHRLLLELAWEAFEDGCVVPAQLAGSRTGVFVGISSHDYGDLQSRPSARHQLDAHTPIGAAAFVAANRLSYHFDLRGPSLALDTACSSSLTAVHLACRSLASGECDLALAAGVNALITPETTIAFCKASMLSPDGRSKSFDARANGYVRGEGGGVVVLKPLEAALASGDRIYAVICGSAVNQDGRTSSMPVPSGTAHEALLWEALGDAGIEPRDVQFVEAHGTGTAVGDPIEATALGRVFSLGRGNGEACLLGSVKTNIGHLEAGAGIAGLIKVALALKHRRIPPHLHFEVPNPDIPFETLRLRVPTTLEDWPAAPPPAMAGVNSFGVGGANAHVLVAEGPHRSPDLQEHDSADPQVLTISARSPEALDALVQRYAEHVAANADATLRDLCRSAVLGRSHHEHRLAVIASSLGELAERLANWREVSNDVVSGKCRRHEEPKLAFVFTGMGPQWWGMGRRLMAGDAVFKKALEECDAALTSLAGWSLIDVLSAAEAESRVADANFAHVTNCALQIALAALWRSWGIVPEFVIGHSSGEMAAAYVTGALSLPDTMRLAYHRGSLQHRLTGVGAMLAAAISPAEALAAIEGSASEVAIAAVNGPRSVTLSGTRRELDRIAADLAGKERHCRFLPVSVPYHGPQMNRIRGEFLDAITDLPPRAADTRFVSTVTGESHEGLVCDAEYWWRNVREPVRFADGMQRLIERGCECFVEVGPHPVLAGSIQECLSERGHRGVLLPTLRRMEDDRRVMLRSLAALYVHGRRVEWPAVVGPRGNFVTLPLYPWQRERHWLEPSADDMDAVRPAGDDSGHPLLGRRVRTATPTWDADLADGRLSFLDEHAVQGRSVLPGAAYIELALASARAQGRTGVISLENVEFQKLLFLETRRDVLLQVQHSPRESTVEIHAAPRSTPTAWSLHAVAGLNAESGAAGERIDLPAISARCTAHENIEALYRTIDEHGIGYGPAFQAIRELRSGDGEALGRIELTGDAAADVAAYEVHPALLDAAFQVIAAIGMATRTWPHSGGGPLVPISIARLELFRKPGARAWVHASLTQVDNEFVEGTARLIDDSGELVLSCERLRLRALEGSERSMRAPIDRYLYENVWAESPLEKAPASQCPAPAVLQASTAAAVMRARAGWNGAKYYEVVEPALEQVAALFIRRALARMGCDPAHEIDAQSLGVTPGHHRVFDRLVAIVRSAGAAETAHGPLDPERELDRAVRAHSDHAAEFELLASCGRRLNEILRGELDAREVLFGDALDALARCYSDTPPARFANEVAAQIVATALSAAPRARVVELGAGTGGTTSAIFEAIRSTELHYLFTDVSPFFIGRAKDRYGDRRGLRFGLMNIEIEPGSQESHAFDIVVAANVLHATTDLRTTLRNVRRLLAPGGLIVLIEHTRPAPRFDVMFGLLDGWWAFADRDLRPSHALLDASSWQELLRESGFEDIVTIADDRRASENVIAARVAAASLRPTAGTKRRWIVYADRGGVAERVATELRSRGQTATLVYHAESFRSLGDGVIEMHEQDAGRLLSEVVRSAEEPFAVLHLWSLDATRSEGASTADMMGAHRRGCGSVLGLVHAIERRGSPACELWLVTAGSQCVDPIAQNLNVAQAPLWGFGRVLANEQPGLSCRMVDLGDGGPEEISGLVAEMSSAATESEVALRGTRRFVHRMQPIQGGVEKETAKRRQAPFHLEANAPGVLESLALRETTVPTPGPLEVLVRVKAAALNFRDVLLALGTLPAGAAGQGANALALGSECSGVVAACGECVTAFHPGDEVIALAAGALGSHVLTHHELVARKPPQMSFEDAAGIPAAFLTADYALNALARIGRGERVLVHAATGGVGLAAVQAARRAGAEVFATAGTTEKRDYLRSIGVRHVMDSRSLAFADEVLRATNGEGVDVVLNSLAGEAIRKGLAILRPYGRFVELGKRDIYQNSPLGLLPFRNNLSFFAVDLFPLHHDRPAFIGDRLRQIVSQVAEGTLEVLPRTTFDIASAPHAFRLMAQAKHIGKVVLSVSSGAHQIKQRRNAPICLAEATYLITGGTGGLGVAVANWMVRQGARHVVLISRSGELKERGEDLEALERSGATISIIRADAADEAALATALEAVRRTMPPLKGIVHAAMVLDDGLIAELDDERFHRVLSPKIAGAWNLHSLTLHDDLDFFVLFSSISAAVGYPSQANYAAANAFLDALAPYRRALGLPGNVISWGTVSGVGYVARHKDILERLDRMGIDSLTAPEALEALERTLRRDFGHVIASRLDWRRLASWNRMTAASEASTAPGGAVRSRAADHGGDDDVLAQLRNTTPDQRHALLQVHVVDRVAAILGASPERIDPERALTEIGFDSLMAVELLTVLKLGLGIQVQMVKLLEGISPRELASLALAQLAFDESPSTRADLTKAPPAEPGGAVPDIANATSPADLEEPLSHEQRRLWLLDRLDPGNASYNVYASALLRGPLDVPALERSLDAIVRRHAVLRAVFATPDGEPMQRIKPPVPILLRVVDVPGASDAARLEAARQLATGEIQRPFDLTRGPLLRAVVLRVDAEQHVVLIVVHHIVADFRAMTIVAAETMAFYNTYTSNRPLRLTDAPSYSDYVRWQRASLTSDVLDRQLSYWTAQLAGARHGVDLPADRANPATSTSRGGHVAFELDERVSRGLMALSRREGVTLFMTLVAAFQTLLHRYSSEDDISVGTSVTTRRLPGADGIVGCLMNTIVLRSNLAGDPTFVELLGRVGDVSLAAFEHQDLPFDRLVAALRPERTAGRSPFFNTMLVFHRGLPELAMPGLVVTPFELESGTCVCDLMLVIDAGEQLRVSLEYRADLFDAPAARRIANHFTTLLGGIIENPGARISRLPILTVKERREILVDRNATSREFPSTCLHELVEAQADRTPDAVAVTCGAESMTYRTLDRAANALAGRLKEFGVEPATVVAVCAARSAATIVGVLGVLKAGGAFLPLDPALPDERLAFMLGDAGAITLVADASTAARLQGLAPLTVVLEPERLEHAGAERPPNRARGNSLAYVIYTSGSAGRPKGVMIPHAAIANQVQWRQSAFPLTSKDVVLHSTSPAFDPSVWEIFGPLSVGARVALSPPAASSGDPDALLRLIAEERATVLQVVPSVLELLLEQPDLARAETLTHIFCGGETLRQELRDRCLSRLAARLHNLYGPTEAAIDATYWTCRATDPLVPIGRPIANARVYVLDEHRQLVPDGVPGELYIGGAGLARGYVHRPELAAERFVANPFEDAADARLYRSGDRVRWLSDGTLDLLGRLDDQVKIRGCRVEPGEIEAALVRHPAVADAVVVAHEPAKNDRSLIAYIVADGQAPDARELLHFLAATLPEYMRPSAFVTLDALPRTASGKVDRRVLRCRSEATQPRRAFAAPRDATELQLMQLWESVLSVRPIGVTDNFFELGGHSLLAAQLMTKIRQTFGQELPLASVFEGATIERLARVLRRETGAESTALVPLETSGSKQPFFCVHPLAGHVFCYVELARHFAGERPFYALQASGLAGGAAPHASIEAMAAHYVDAVRTVQPQGPYSLGGWSMGGMVAFEMARQLRSGGEEVASLVLLDTWVEPEIEAFGEDAMEVTINFLAQLGVPVGNGLWVESLQSLTPDDRFAVILERARTAGVLPPDTEVAGLTRHFDVFAAHFAAIREYVPQPYDGRIALLSPNGRTDAGAALGWRALASGLDVHTVPGDHNSMLGQPNVAVVAKRLKVCLADA